MRVLRPSVPVDVMSSAKLRVAEISSPVPAHLLKLMEPGLLAIDGSSGGRWIIPALSCLANA